MQGKASRDRRTGRAVGHPRPKFGVHYCQPTRPQQRSTGHCRWREAYAAIDSLLVYVLLEQDSAAAVVYRRGAMGFVREVWLGREATIPLAEVGCELRLCDAYDNVVLAS